MKNIFKLSVLMLVMTLVWSCESDDDKVIAQGLTGPQIENPNQALELIEEAEDITAFTLVWSDADYDVNTEVNYTIEIDNSGNNFTEAVVVGKTIDRLFTWTVKEINDVALGKGLVAGEAGALEVRVKSALGSDNFDEMISEVIILTVTPYEAAVVPIGGPKFFMVGNFQKYYEAAEWTPTEAIRMKHIGANDEALVFEAFVKLNQDDGFKFINDALDWSELESNIGTIGGAQDGNLENSGGSSDIKAPETGLYYVKLDVDNLTYQLVKMDWGIIGDATSGGWDAETAMTYGFDNNKFTISTGLANGQLKFRCKNASNVIFGDGEDWKFNIGTGDPIPADIGDGNFDITSGNFDIEFALDFIGNATIMGL